MGRLFGKPKTYDQDFFDPEYKSIRGAMPQTKAGINRRIEAFYLKNQKKIDEISDVVFTEEAETRKYEQVGGEDETPLGSFKESVWEKINKGYNVNDSIRMTINSHEYTSEDLIANHNFMSGLKADGPSSYKFRRAIGWQEKFEISNLNYEGWDPDLGLTFSYESALMGTIYIGMTYQKGQNSAYYTFYDSNKEEILFK